MILTLHIFCIIFCLLRYIFLLPCQTYLLIMDWTNTDGHGFLPVPLSSFVIPLVDLVHPASAQHQISEDVGKAQRAHPQKET